MDILKINRLEAFAYHGVFEEEKKLGQKFSISIEAFYSMQEAGMTGDLSKSIHYGELSAEIMEEFCREKYDLIETAAEKLSAFILIKYPMIKSLKVTVEKPWAPVHLHMDPVSITTYRSWKKVFVGLGSNMGDRESYLEESTKRIRSMKEVRNFKESQRIKTKAWGKEDQDDFLNSAVFFETFLEPQELLKILQKYEAELGRVRHEKWGPRTIDMDILFFDNLIINEENLIVPHPYVAEREFVLKSLNELNPHFIHPVLNKSIRVLLEELNAK